MKNAGMRQLLADLQERGPMTAHDLAAVTGLAIPSVIKYALRLRRRGDIHIGAWERGPTLKQRAVYALGPGKDAPRLPRYTQPKPEPVEEYIPVPRIPQPSQIEAALMGVRL